eukprot:m.384550 g.384550  ORF g.384550 m.384550 type:complete len:59 (-) comp132811_c0_seq1:145-321(-)
MLPSQMTSVCLVPWYLGKRVLCRMSDASYAYETRHTYLALHAHVLKRPAHSVTHTVHC